MIKNKPENLKKSNCFLRQIQQLISGEKPTFILWLIVFFIVILFLCPYIFTRNSCIPSIDYSETGQIGETIGGLTTPLIALLATILAFSAFWIQFQANISQKEQFKKQNIDLKIERFENKFFNLLKIYDNIVSQTIYIEQVDKQSDSGKVIGKRDNYIYGREAIKRYYSDFCDKTLLKYLEESKTISDSENKRKLFNTDYLNFLDKNQHVFGHYFRTIYQILKFLYINKEIFDKQDSESINDKFYSNILRASLSSQELLFIYFNGISEIALYNSDKQYKYKNLINEFSFFEHLSPVSAIDMPNSPEKESVYGLLSLYDKESYGENYESVLKLFSKQK